jgi:hypothetical protein
MIDVNTFMSELTNEKIIHLGVLNNLYSDFTNHVNTFLNYEEGFDSLFTMTNEFDINGGIFDSSSFIDILNEKVMNTNGEYVKKSVGNIVIPNVSTILKNMNELNVFNNRSQTVNNFLNGDLIYVPDGVTITLRIDIDSGNGLQLNSYGTDFLNNLNQTSNIKKGDIYQNTITTTNEIIRTVKVPLLIKLSNLSNNNMSSNRTITSMNDDQSVYTNKDMRTYTNNNIKIQQSVKLDLPNIKSLTTDLSNNFISYNGANGETGENGGNNIDNISYIEGPTGEESSEIDTQIKRPFYNYIKHRRILNPAFS